MKGELPSKLLLGGKGCYCFEMCRDVRSSSVSTGGQKYYNAGHRCFINTWKWLLRWALNYKCNFLSAISPQEEEMKEEQFTFKL